MYLIAIMDWYSRRVLAWEISNTLETGFCLRTMRRAIVSGDSVRDVVISPETEVREILGQLQLPSDYWLSTRDGQPLHANEAMYGMVVDGDKLFASPPAINMALIKLWTQRHGRPVAIYSDWASHFKQTPKRGRQNALKPTQIQRALGELDMVLIAAHSPQAKGRVERSHGTDQDRLVKEMRLAGISTQAAANRFLEEVYLGRVEEKFAVAPASAVDAHRDAEGYDLEAIFSVQEERRVAGDYTVQVDGVAWQIERGEITGGLRGGKVLVERRGDGTMRLRWW